MREGRGWKEWSYNLKVKVEKVREKEAVERQREGGQ